ncbi:MAG: helix-turn-helix transcriptional regulator [Bacillus sp. (in: Bacteria)]|nr:helix-turn-helix transcriptional regulator [Bacillus sp. (in: firmicutes)]
MLMIREFRKRTGLTMKQLGAKVGASESSISQYETGRVEPDVETLMKIADALNVTVDDLMGRSKKERQVVHNLSDLDIRFALSGGETPITQAQFNEVKQFVRFIKERDSDAKHD